MVDIIKEKSPIIEAVATLMGATVGAGILGIPYAVSKVGFGPSLILIIILCVCNMILQLMFAEVILRTERDHQIPGYGYIYLGRNAKRISLAVGMVAGYGTILAYLIGQGEVFSALFRIPEFAGSMIFFVFGTMLIYRGLRTIKRFEVVMTCVVFLITMIIGIFTAPHIELYRLNYWNVDTLFVLYGVMLFALSGTAIIPEVRKELMHREVSFPNIIITANVAILLIYVSFMFFVVGVTGTETTEVATVGLGRVVGPIMVIIGNFLAFFTISTSFLALGLAMRRMFQYDYHMKRSKAIIMTMAVPLTLYALGIHDFIKVLSIVGGVILSVQSGIIIFSFWKARKTGDRKPEFTLGHSKIVGTVLLIVFILGAIFTLIESF